MFEHNRMPTITIEFNEKSWLKCSVDGASFRRVGDLSKLEMIIEIFRNWIESLSPGQI